MKLRQLTPFEYSALVSMVQEWYFGIPENIEARPLSELLDTSNVRIFTHGKWAWCYDAGVIWYQILEK